MESFTPPASCVKSMTEWYVSSINGVDVLGPASTDGGCFPSGYKGDVTTAYTMASCPASYRSGGKITTSSLEWTVCCPVSV